MEKNAFSINSVENWIPVDLGLPELDEFTPNLIWIFTFWVIFQHSENCQVRFFFLTLYKTYLKWIFFLQILEIFTGYWHGIRIEAKQEAWHSICHLRNHWSKSSFKCKVRKQVKHWQSSSKGYTLSVFFVNVQCTKKQIFYDM